MSCSVEQSFIIYLAPSDESWNVVGGRNEHDPFPRQQPRFAIWTTSTIQPRKIFVRKERPLSLLPTGI